MYALIAISWLCQEESLRGLKDQRHSAPFNQTWDKKIGAVGPLAPAPLSFKTRGAGSNGQVWTRHLAPVAPAPRPSSPLQFQ